MPFKTDKEVLSLFNKHKITYENSQSVLYLFTQSFDADLNLIRGIFQHLHEDVLLDWTDDYIAQYDITFVGDLIRVVAGTTIVRDLEFPLYMKNHHVPTTTSNKILRFPAIKRKHG